MIVHAMKGGWWADSQYEENAPLKAAGWWWHPGPDGCRRKGCEACQAGLRKKWWTPFADKAARLRQVEGDVQIEWTPEAAAAVRATERSLEASRAVDAEIEVPAPEGLDYLPFQRAGIAYALARPGTLIADQMGLGKTIQALGLINAAPTVKRVLIVCPASLRINWQREAEKWLVQKWQIHVVMSAKAPPADAEIIIINPDRLKGKILDALMSRTWDLIVVDECQICKNPRAARTKKILGEPARKGKEAVPGLVDRAARKLFLTGTPILNRPIEIQPVAGALDRRQFGSFFGFAKRYAGAYQSRWGWVFDGASNLAELQDKLRASIMIRRIKSEVLTELPPKRRQIIELDLSGFEHIVGAEQESWARHEQMIADAEARTALAHAEGDDASYEAAVRDLRSATSAAFTEMARVRHETAVAKVPQVIEHVDSLLEGDEEQKVLVFAHHHDVVDALAVHWGAKSVVLTGRNKPEERDAAVQRFQNDPACRVFIGSIQAAGVGLTLTAADLVVFAELDWVPANMSQAEDRCHRIGQRRQVLVQHLVFDGSLDAQMAKTLVAKQTIMDQALDLRAERIKIEAQEPVTPSAQGHGRPREYPKATPEQREAAARGVQQLAGLCDGARKLDGAGFNRVDTRLGHELAMRSQGRPLTDGEVWLAAKMVRRYRRQLSAEIVEVLSG
uniref:Putative helicase n=1 Tax=viral metagenome TaxID=1070528 RepID=A0A6M3MF64_9ZZZZ